jgi:membrane protein DedA with SNARE-associated domain
MFDLLDGPVREAITAVYAAVGYLGVALWVALETVIIPIPSELVLPFAGFLVGADAAGVVPLEPLTGAPWAILPLTLAATVGSLVGGLLSYAIGARLGRPVLLVVGARFGVGERELGRVEGWFERYGARAALFGRLVPVLRSVVGYTAGLGRMPIGRYLLYTALGSLPFNLLLISAGAALGANWEETLAPLLKGAERTVLVLLTVVAIVYALRRYRQRH